MPYVSYKIEGYDLTYSTIRHGPQIHLTCERDVSQTLYFRPNGSTLPWNCRDLYYHLDDFQNIHDLLRNHMDSLYLYLGNEGTGYDCGISIGDIHGP